MKTYFGCKCEEILYSTCPWQTFRTLLRFISSDILFRLTSLVTTDQLKMKTKLCIGMETLYTLPVLCELNPPVTGEYPHKWPVIWSFSFYFCDSLNKLLFKWRGIVVDLKHHNAYVTQRWWKMCKLITRICYEQSSDHNKTRQAQNFIFYGIYYIENNVFTRVTNCFSVHERVILVFISRVAKQPGK